MIEEPSYMTALHALVPEVKEKNICVVFDGRANVTYWEKYDAEPPAAEEILAELKKQVIEWDRVKYYRDRKEYLPDPYDLIWMLYNDIKCGNIESGSFMSSLNESVEKFPEP